MPEPKVVAKSRPDRSDLGARYQDDPDPQRLAEPDLATLEDAPPRQKTVLTRRSDAVARQFLPLNRFFDAVARQTSTPDRFFDAVARQTSTLDRFFDAVSSETVLASGRRTLDCGRRCRDQGRSEPCPSSSFERYGPEDLS